VTDGEPDFLTRVETDLSIISYTFGDDEDDETKVAPLAPRRGAILESQLRNNEDKAELESKRRDHQKEIFDALQKAGLEKFAKGAESSVEKKKAVFKKFEAYRKDAALPKMVSTLKANKN
jgi:nucleosome binding factor SPN SPT16 subunit